MRWLATSAVVLAAHLAGAQPAPAPTPATDPATAYLRDPVGGRAALLALDRPGSGYVSPLSQLLIGVIHLRDGNASGAVRVFRSVAERADTPLPLRPTAWNGIAWAELSRGDFPAARVALETANSIGTPVPLSITLLGLIDASDGLAGDAIDRLTPITLDMRSSPSLRAVARYGAAFARFHSGDFETAATEFAAVADDPMASDLADDARYASGLAHWRAGDRDTAIHIWRGMIDAQFNADDAPPVPRSLLRLDANTWLRGGLRRLRSLPLAPQDVQLLHILDHDGRAMAAAMLARVGDTGSDETSAPPEGAGNDPAAAAGPATTRPRLRKYRKGLAGVSGTAASGRAGKAAGGANGGLFTGAPATPGAGGTTSGNDDPAHPHAGAQHASPSTGNDGTSSAPSNRTILAALAIALLAGGLWLRRGSAQPSR